METKKKQVTTFLFAVIALATILLIGLLHNIQATDNQKSVSQELPTALPTPTTVVLIFDPPERARIISNDKVDYVLAGNNVDYLTKYEKKRSNSTQAKAMMNDQKVVYYVRVRTKVLLIKYDGDYARVKLLEDGFALSGTLCWVHKENVIPSW